MCNDSGNTEDKMELCYPSDGKPQRVIVFKIMYLLESGILFLAGLFLGFTQADKNPWDLCCCLILFAILILLYGTFNYKLVTKTYSLSDLGVTLKYGKKLVFYPWAYISQIFVCELIRGGVDKDIVIWCSVGKPKDTPLRISHRWRRWNCELFHQGSFFTVEYSPERLQEFKQYSKRGIPDFRNHY